MTVSSANNKDTYSGNGSTTVFAYTFRILDEDEILVQLKDANGVFVTQTKTTHYTVSGVGESSGGNITMVTAPASGETLVLTRNMPFTQTTDYLENDTFPAETHETALDRHTMEIQQLKEEVDRTVKFDETVTGTSSTLPVPTADRYLRFNSDASAIEAVGLASGGGIENLVDDPSPQLGGNLDVNAQAITSTGSNSISFVPATGELIVLGTSSSSAFLTLREDTDNGTNSVALKCPASVASSLTFTLPSVDATFNGAPMISDASGNLSFASVLDLNPGGNSITVLNDTSDANEGGQINLAPGTSYSDNLIFDYFQNSGRLLFSSTADKNITISNIGSGDISLSMEGATGSPTGSGWINATAVYDDGTLLTCYVFDQAVEGSIDNAKWDKKVPKAVHTAKKRKTKSKAKHEPMRKFKSRIGSEYDPLDIDKYSKHWKDKKHLTSMPNEDKFKAEQKMPAGEWIQRLVETVEIQAVHIDNLNQRLKQLEGKK